MKKQNGIPFEFVIEKLEPVHPVVKPMFGCFAIYVKEKMTLMLRLRADYVQDNGVWVAIPSEHQHDLKKKFPALRQVAYFGSKKNDWLNLPHEEETFEEEVMKLCELILKNDQRLGKIPKSKSK